VARLAASALVRNFRALRIRISSSFIELSRPAICGIMVEIIDTEAVCADRSDWAPGVKRPNQARGFLFGLTFVVLSSSFFSVSSIFSSSRAGGCGMSCSLITENLYSSSEEDVVMFRVVDACIRSS